jgi:TolA-binding protein
MSFKKRRIFIPAILFICLQHPGYSQENAGFQQPGMDYRMADNLFRHSNYGSARQVYHDISTNLAIDDPGITTTAEFKEAVSAAELNNGDAPSKISKFIETYPENALAADAKLYLGVIYFKDNKFKDAIKAFQGVNVSSLSKSGRDEFNFMYGYSQLKTGDHDAAKTYFQRVSNQKSPYYTQARYFIAHIDYLQGNYKPALKTFENLEYDSRYDKIIPLYKIQIYHYLGDYGQIIAIGPAMVESANITNKADIARITGNAYFNAEDYKNAAIYLNIYKQNNRKSLSREDHYLLGFVNYKAGDYKNAIDDLQKAIHEDDALSQNASYYLGVCYNETGQKKYAGTAFLSAYKNDIDKDLADEALFDYIKISLESPGNPYNEAISLLESWLKEHPGSPRESEAFGYLSSLYLSSRNYKQALVSMDQVANKNKQMQAAYQKIIFYRAAELFNMQDMEGSLDLYKKASEMTFDESIRAESLYWAGEISYRQGNYLASIKYYQDFLNSKQAKKSAFYANAYYNLGYSYFNRKEYGDAITQFNKFAEDGMSGDPKLISDACLRLGDSYFISKQFDKAIANYDRVILAKDPSADYALYYKALSEGAKGDFNRKIDVMKKLNDNYPGSIYIDDALYETAMAYILLNQENQALVYFDKLVQGHPTSGKAIQASMRKGFIYFNRNDYNDAISSFKHVVEKFPGTQESQEALAALKNVYVETGQIDQYYAFAKGLSFTEINSSEEDSLNYEVAENLYMQGKCDQAINSFKKYIDSFPNGAYSSNAYYYQAQCYLKSDQLEPALEGFKKVAEGPRSKFTEAALATASSMEYSSENYSGALPLFEQLETVAEDPANTVASVTGQMRCYYRLKNYPSAVLACQKLLSSSKVTADLSNEAHFILGQSYLAQGDLTQAEYEFTLCSKLTGTETGAEASYQMAAIAFQTGRMAEAEARVYTLQEKFAAYDYWVAKGFILLSDVFLKNGNEFQARQTLQSVLDNYKGPELGAVAKEKLDSLSK